MEQRIALLGGAGKIGSSIVGGMLSAGKIDPDKVVITARHEHSLERVSHLGVAGTLDNLAAVDGADVVGLCVHPDEVRDLLARISPALAPGQMILSVVTGVSTGAIEKALGSELPVVRGMPNVAVFVRESVTVLCSGRHAGPKHVELARRIFDTVGVTEVLDEKHMDASTGLGGCGPAFAFKMIEALAEGGVKMGLPREVSRRVAAQVLKGAAQLVLETGKHPAALKDEVTTPGGCTIDGITKLEERGLAIALIEAVETSSRKASLLSRSNGS